MRALVTGASSGIGREFARAYAAQGDDLVLVARRKDRLAALAAELKAAHGVSIEVLARDLGEPGAAEGLVGDLSERHLSIDVLVNCAGFAGFGDVADSDPEVSEQQVQVNAVALTGLVARLLPAMIARGQGTIVNVASVAAFMPVPHLGVYSATKAYVLSLTEALWYETRGTGVRVLAVCPGPIATEFFTVGGGTAQGRLTQPDAVVRKTLQVLRASSRSSFVLGAGNALVARLAVRLMPKRLVLALGARTIARTVGGEPSGA